MFAAIRRASSRQAIYVIAVTATLPGKCHLKVWPRTAKGSLRPGATRAWAGNATQEQTQPNPLLKPTCYLEVPRPSSSSGSLAMFAAIRRPSSLLSNLAAAQTFAQPSGNHRAAASALSSARVLKAMAAPGAPLWTALTTASNTARP
jgi:hypothetical protein